jgi:sugar lactone lactonase YvrE
MSFPEWIPEAVRYGHDEESGADIEQLTSEPVTSTNIYCEQRYASADGTRIAIKRKPFGRPAELWVCDLRSMRVCKAAEGIPLGANSPLNAIYYLTSPDESPCLMRLDLTNLSAREMFRFNDGTFPKTIAISPDERFFAAGPFPVKENVFSLHCVDLASGHINTLCEIEDMFNPHIQFDPANGRRILVQINRGGRLNLSNGGESLTGPMGATLCVVDVESRKTLPLPAGRPHTPPISGHECWVGRSGRLLFTAGHYKVSSTAFVTLGEPPETERDMPSAAIYSVAPGEKAAQIVTQELLFNHIAASDDGRFFIADDHATGRIYVGSIATGRCLHLCETYTRQGICQHSHVHSYMTPDNQYVIFDSIVTGVAQVYAARIPAGFLNDVLKK